MQILAMNKRLTGRDSKLFQINTFNQLHDPPSVLLISHLHTDKRQPRTQGSLPFPLKKS